MNEQDDLEVRFHAVNDKVSVLQSELRASQHQIAKLLEAIEKQQDRLNSQESTIGRVDRILMEILSGRTWRTLRATGELVKKLAPSRLGGNSRKSVALSRKRSYLFCDEPKGNDNQPRSGTITIRGWCLSEGGVESVQLQVPGLPRVETLPSVPRPDVKKAHPDLDQTGKAGFALEFDSLSLPKGHYTLRIRAISEGVPVRETTTSIYIDHEKGFASDYDRWIHEFERPDDDLIEVKLPSIQHRPLISILMPVYNTDPSELKAAIESVRNQSLSNWELCIADDCSTHSEIREILEGFAEQDPRIKVTFQSQRGGISKTCNAAWQMAVGEYIAFLDHDDTLTPHALAHICETLDRSPEADLLYTDEDKIDTRGKRFDPFFKPAWSPDLLLSENYISHLLVLRQDLAQNAGTFDPECDGSQDYDLMLRAVRHAKRIEHIPKVLYHWRAGFDSTASSLGNKQYALDAAQKALQRFANQGENPMTVEPAAIPGRWRARYFIPSGARVSIIIASGGKVDVLRANLESLFGKTAYANYEVVVIDNSKSNAIKKLVAQFQSRPQSLRYIDWRNKPFNYSGINNAAARQCESSVLLFLNDDTSAITPEWLEAMVELVMRPEVGVVGAKLLYPDGRIQHAGVVMGVYDNCGHAFKGLDGSVSHYFDFSDIIRNVSAVTGACLMTKRDIFWQVGGFDEVDFAVAFNDVDLCLKIGSLGYRVLYTPHAVLYHYEAFSKTSKDLVPHPEEVAHMRFKWDRIIAADPYYSPNLTRNEEDYSLKRRS
jgi:GT2 family glycosyltransferase